MPRGYPATGTARSGYLREFVHPGSHMSDYFISSLPDHIERIGRALTAVELAVLLAVSRITIFKLVRAGRISCFHIGTCVRFDPRAVETGLRKM